MTTVEMTPENSGGPISNAGERAEGVWVRTGRVLEPYRRVDPAPWKADALGHVWYFDGGASDPDDPRSCTLCVRPAWQVCDTPCENADRLGEANAERARWIEENRLDEPPNTSFADFYGMAWAAWRRTGVAEAVAR